MYIYIYMYTYALCCDTSQPQQPHANPSLPNTNATPSQPHHTTPHHTPSDTNPSLPQNTFFVCGCTRVFCYLEYI